MHTILREGERMYYHFSIYRLMVICSLSRLCIAWLFFFSSHFSPPRCFRRFNVRHGNAYAKCVRKFSIYICVFLCLVWLLHNNKAENKNILCFIVVNCNTILKEIIRDMYYNNRFGCKHSTTINHSIHSRGLSANLSLHLNFAINFDDSAWVRMRISFEKCAPEPKRHQWKQKIDYTIYPTLPYT